VVHKNNDGGSSGARTYRTAGTRTRVSPAPSPPCGARRCAATEASPLVGGRPGGAPSCVTGSLTNIRLARSDRLPKLTQEKNSDRNETENHFAKTFPKTFPKMEEASPRHRARPPGAAYVVGYAGMQKERGGHAKGVVCASLCVGASEKSVTEGSKNQNVEIRDLLISLLRCIARGCVPAQPRTTIDYKSSALPLSYTGQMGN
jgi:hypothetical protein